MNHVPELVKLEKVCFPRPWTEREFELCFRQGHFHAKGIFRHERMIAYITFFTLVDEIEIVNLAVHEDHRRKGLGTSLLGALLAHGREHGCTRIVLEVRRSNMAARHLYTHHGFKIVGERKGYYPPSGEDALVMARSCPNA
ncbi:ribosomal protein S18-alanine N-acetyltransferase [Desulfoplanes formicivorans]|uniref:ribosomal protein S18-alanine N-acetyltransferase n=1 Tax=Desulfoplanes formicivorans TaxID=1592317 RepID=UPI0015B4AA85|nr:ribosomal protein S18-alanine N-acetyltransferase [Desulfoplanes formicivorans]